VSDYRGSVDRQRIEKSDDISREMLDAVTTLGTFRITEATLVQYERMKVAS